MSLSQENENLGFRCNCGGILQPHTAQRLNFRPLSGLPFEVRNAPCLRCNQCGAKRQQGEFIELAFVALTYAVLQSRDPFTAPEAKHLRKELNLSPLGLAQRLLVSESAVLAWEACQAPIPAVVEQHLRLRVLMLLFDQIAALHPSERIQVATYTTGYTAKSQPTSPPARPQAD